MKKIIILFCLFLCFLGALHSLDGEFGISFGFLGLGYDYNVENNEGHFFYFGRLLNIMYQSETGIGVTLSPINFSVNVINNDNYVLSFVNAFVYYNFFNRMRERYMLGPFVSVHAVDIRDMGFFEIRSGLKFSLRNTPIFTLGARGYRHDGSIYEDRTFHFDMIVLELGYKYNRHNGSGFYAFFGMDIFPALITISGLLR